MRSIYSRRFAFFYDLSDVFVPFKVILDPNALYLIIFLPYYYVLYLAQRPTIQKVLN